MAILILAAGCASVPPAAKLVVTQRVEHLDKVAREPMFAEHPQGALFVSGYWEPRPTLWKSQDRGATWSRVDVGPAAEGNSDVDLAVAADGTLYFVTMTYDRKANEGQQVAMGVSRDAGTSWQWTTLSKTRFDDRPWVEVARDGTAHAIWNDGSGVSHTVSRDRGATWSPVKRIHDRGGSSHLALGPAGELAVRSRHSPPRGTSPGSTANASSSPRRSRWRAAAPARPTAPCSTTPPASTSPWPSSATARSA